MVRLLAAVIGLLVALGAGSAEAAQRYAAPGGGGTACSQTTPCSLSQAITGAGEKDEVIVTAGTYTVGSAITVPAGAKEAHIHGDFSGAIPRLEASLTGPLIVFGALGVRLGFLEIVNQGPTSPFGFICPYEGEVDRLSATVVGTNAVAAYASASCEIRDSLLRAGGDNAIALFGSVSTSASTSVRNTTAIASGSGSVGARSSFNGVIFGSYTLNLANVIVSGGQLDLQASSGPFGPGNITVNHSNFDEEEATGSAKITGSDNQTAPPVFVDSAAGNYRQAAGSPTIDAGTSDGISPLDLDGNPRSVGAAPDIGAYEYVPPEPVVTEAPMAALLSLRIAPKVFRPVNAGGSVFARASASRQARKRVKIGATVRYSLSEAGAVRFTVERAVKGRKVGGKCRKATSKNRKRRPCRRWLRRKGRFGHTGTAGGNRFRFSGRLRGKALPRGSYRLVGRINGTVKRAKFKIVR